MVDEKHEQLRKILIDYECKEYGDAIIDEISQLFGYPDTIEVETIKEKDEKRMRD